MKDQICKAIRNRQVIQLYYDGGIREVEPFTLGRHKTTQNLLLSAYQTGGYSKGGEVPGWKLLYTSEIYNWSVTNKTAPPVRPGYNPNDSRMGQIICTY